MADEQVERQVDPNAPAGWYPDTNRGSGVRYWDGTHWTEDRADDVAPKPLRQRAIWAAIAVLLVMAAGAADGIVAMEYADVLKQQINDGDVTPKEADDIEIAFGLVSVLYLLAVIAGAIGFIIWFHRAFSNLRFLTGSKLRYGTGQAIWTWFVPIMNLFRPKQVANDIWRGSGRDAVSNRNWTALDVSPILHWWWAFWLFSSIAGNVAGGMISADPVLTNDVATPSLDDGLLRDERSAAVAVAISSAVQLVSGALAIAFIRAATRRQEERIAEDRAGEPVLESPA